MLSLLALALSSCSDPAPFAIRYETEHFRIGTEFDYPLCGGDLAALDAQIDGLEELLSVTAPSPITLYLWETPPTAYCGEGPMGCYGREDNVVHSTAYILDHELVHAVVGGFADPPAFFSEGAAEALRRRRLVSVQTPAPLANFEREREELDYGSAGLFMRWLWEREGPELFVELLQDTRGPLDAFEAIYGLTPEAAEQAFFSDLPHSYPPLIDCELPELPMVDETRWEESAPLDCARSDVRAGREQLATARQLTISEAGSYAVSFTGATATINRCADEVLDSAPVEGDPSWGDVPPTSASMPEQYVRALDEQGEQLELAPGRYMLVVTDTPGSLVSLAVEGVEP